MAKLEVWAKRWSEVSPRQGKPEVFFEALQSEGHTNAEPMQLTKELEWEKIARLHQKQQGPRDAPQYHQTQRLIIIRELRVRCEVEATKPEELRHAATKLNEATVGAPDGCEPAEKRKMPIRSRSDMAKLLNKIESEIRWPKAAEVVPVACLSAGK